MQPYQKRKSRMSDIICRRADKHLTEGQLKDIAALIYDTDLYIYPAMFADRQEAETVLPKMIRAGDPMFRRENLFLTMQGTKVVGILLCVFCFVPVAVIGSLTDNDVPAMIGAVILFLCIEKHLVAGLTSGGVKG